MKTYIKVSVISLAFCALSACAGNQQDQTGDSNGFSVQNAPQALNALISNPEVADNYACGNQGVLICHLPPGNPANKHSLCIGAPAVEHHLKEHKRGDLQDYLGACSADDSGSGSGSSGSVSDGGGSPTDGGSTAGGGADGSTGGSTGTDGSSGGSTTGGSTDGSTGGGSTGGYTGGVIDCTLPGSNTNTMCM